MDEQLVTAGGRVFSVAATGATLKLAVANAYKDVAAIQFAGIFNRRDIALKWVMMPILRYNELIVDGI